MTDDNTKPDKLEVTWTPATCEGLPPVGSKVAVQWPNRDNEGYRLLPATIVDYLPPDHPFRPVYVNGNEPWIYVSLDGMVGIQGYFAASKSPLLGIEKQPKGWPDIQPPKLFENLLYSYQMDEPKMAAEMIHWLKDNGYLKR